MVYLALALAYLFIAIREVQADIINVTTTINILKILLYDISVDYVYWYMVKMNLKGNKMTPLNKNNIAKTK